MIYTNYNGKYRKLQKAGVLAVNINKQSKSEVNIEEMYQTYKPYLFSIAYRILGSVMDAEDIIQDMFISIREQPLASDISNLQAYLSKMVTNRCLNELKLARRRRETYTGPWLPEPLITGNHPLEKIEQEEMISYAFLVMLDKLSPEERVVFVLREALGCDYHDLAEMMDKTVVNCRKIFSRAKKKLLATASPAYEHYPALSEQYIQQFVLAFQEANKEELYQLLAEDAMLVTDGGGEVRSAINPILSRHRILSVLTSKKAFKEFRTSTVTMVNINGQQEILFQQDGVPKGIICFNWNEKGKIKGIYMLLNPTKLLSLRF